MVFRDTPIQRKLMTVILLTSGAVLLLTCAAYFAYEFVTFRRATVRQLTTLGEIVAANSTAALAFDDREAANEILAALRAEPQVVAASLYDRAGRLFAYYPAALRPGDVPAAPGADGFRFAQAHLSGFQPVAQGGQRLGTLYLRSDMEAMYARFRLYAGIAALVTAVSFLLAYLLSKGLQRQISGPILALAGTARAISERRDYSVRAAKQGEDEVGLLTGAFNQMLTQIQLQDQALRESEERTRLMVEGVRDYAIVMLDPAGHLVNWNAGAERIHGYRADEIQGQHFSRFYPEEAARAGFPERDLRVAEEEGRFEDERWRVRRDGTRFWANVVITALRDEEGHLRGFSKVTRDVTERKQAEVELQAQLARLDLLNRITHAIGERQDLPSIFQVVVQSLEDHFPIDFGCVCLYDPEQEMLTLSCAGTRSQTFGPDVAAGRMRIPVDENGLARCVRGQLVYEPDVCEVAAPFPQRLAQAGLRALVLAPLAVESSVFGVLVAARLEPRSFSSPECEFLRQLSEHVALAARQAQLHEALQQAFDDLRQTQQAVMQQERLRALGQMASGIAHDINNAISPVGLYTESLLENEPDLSPRARGYLETIQSAIDDVASTVARVREFYRQREEQLMHTPVHLNRLVQQVLDLTRARWSDIPQQQGVVVEIETALAPDLPAVLGVEGEIRDALTNLVFNAVDAMPEGGTLTFRTLAVEAMLGPDGVAVPRQVVVEVADTGVGMDEDTRRRCLEPFFTTKGERGTGLGLAMVYGVVQRHGAGIEVESAPGRGTTVRLVFPVPADLGEELAAPEAVRATVGQRLRILVVDDDPLILRSMHDILTAEGHAVVTADGGQAGVDAFRAAQDRHEPFGVVITDLGMPYVDGRQVAQAVKEAVPETPVLLLTGWGQRLLADGDVPAHVDRVLSKPPKLRELREALAECFRLPEPGAAS